MFTYPETATRSEGPGEIGPPPYYHRSDCNICWQQDGLKTGSEPWMHPTRVATSSRMSTAWSNTARRVIEVFLITSGHQTEERARAADYKRK